MEFAKENGLWDGKGKFDFHEVYQRDEKLDTTYNYPRVWGLQQLFTPDMVQDVTKNTFPVFAEAKHKITLQDMRTAFRFHYDGTEHDPYLHSNGKEPYRPVSIFRTQQTHIMQVRPWLPKAIGCISYVAFGMADLSVFLPLYQGVKSYPKPYRMGSVGRADNKSAYWKFRRVMTLGMMNYNAYAPIIKAAYTKLEAENDQRQLEMEAEYLKICKDHPMEAQDLLQRFSDRLLKRALEVAEDLELEILSRLTADVETEYLFHGA
jgi:dipeptidase